jgi:uncharacterized caspase-like protein
MRKLRLSVLSFLLFAFVVGDAQAMRRVALVIGNAKYEHAGVLANTLNDAHAIAALLRSSGFDSVDERIDMGVVAIKRAVRDFTAVASNADIAVIYYSGHGIEAGGVNYLIPVDAKLADSLDVEDETLPLDRLVLATSGVKSLSLIILDACRENPFLHNLEGPVTRAVTSHTLTEQATSANTLIAYAAKAGSLSFDGVGRNSPFTTALVKHIAEPGLDIRIALGKVRDDVLEATGRRQEPYVYGSLGGASVSLVPAPEPAVVADPLAGAAADYADAERVGSPEAWRAFIAAHREGGFYVELARAQLNRVAPQPASSHAGAPTLTAQTPQPSPSPSRVAALPSPDPAPTSARVEADPCAAERARLSALRNTTSPDAVAAFAKDMSCAALRPQVVRLMESLGLNSPPTPTPTMTRLAARNPDTSGCEGETRELERLRAAPDPAAAKAFYQRLVCAALRPQVQRLMESLGEIAPANNAQRAPKLGPTAAEDAAACATESGELSQLRANPSRTAALAFAAGLRCRALKPQAERLLESLD